MAVEMGIITWRYWNKQMSWQEYGRQICRCVSTTSGAVIGNLAMAAAGAAVGTLVGGPVGTFIGGIIGGIIGAIAGGYGARKAFESCWPPDQQVI